MDAVVTAGGIPKPGEPLYEYTQGKSKALLDIAGKPMIQWVLDALCDARTIERIIVIGLPPDSGITCSKLADFQPNQGGMLQNIRLGMRRSVELNPSSHHILMVSSDIPAITAEMVDWVVNECMKTDLDAYYNVITRQAMEARFPGSKRSYTRLKDVEVCGGDMNVLRSNVGPEHDAVMEKLIAARKNVFKQASLVGYDTLFLLLFRLITLEQAVSMVTKRLKITGQAVRCPYAEVGMDVDKPFQLEIMRLDLEKSRKPADLPV
jgi:GTP:adenosylcobinamide-phosphate guanylyltransferase